jgi:hypothetical protein
MFSRVCLFFLINLNKNLPFLMAQYWLQRKRNNTVNRSIIDEYNPVVYGDADLWSGKGVVLVLHVLRMTSLR